MAIGSRAARTLLAGVAALAMSASAVVAQTFTVTPSGIQDYMINGVPDPTLTLTRGQTYIFNVDAFGHPFWIKSLRSTGSANRYDNGVTNNGEDAGTVTFTVPLDAPSTLFYNCGVHAAMGGTINILDGATPTRTATTAASPAPTQTRTATTSPSPTASATSTATASPSPTATPTTDVNATPTRTPTVGCVGNCNGDALVTVDDILTLVAIAGGGAEAPDCPNGIPGSSVVDEQLIVTALANALGQCGTGG